MQIRITLSPELHKRLQREAQKYDLTMAGYVKNLIIQDIKGNNKAIYQAPLPIDESVKKKKEVSWEGLDWIDG